jgi:hypothetical protein
MKVANQSKIDSARSLAGLAPGQKMDDEAPDVITHLLRDYEKSLDALKKEDRLVQEAPTKFAELAAKVKAEVERRTGMDRRAGPRPTPDRRGRTETTAPDAVDSE